MKKELMRSFLQKIFPCECYYSSGALYNINQLSNILTPTHPPLKIFVFILQIALLVFV